MHLLSVVHHMHAESARQLLQLAKKLQEEEFPNISIISIISSKQHRAVNRQDGKPASHSADVPMCRIA
jgi:hypothetical protein